MSRKATRRKVWTPAPPKGLRPKLDAGQRLDLALLHHEHLDAMAKGEGTEALLWQVVASIFTWSRAAYLSGSGTEQARVQLQLARDLVGRFARLGRVGFAGQEYQAAKAGVSWADDLAHKVDRAVAMEAAEWSEQAINLLAEACEREGAAAAAGVLSRLCGGDEVNAEKGRKP